MIDNLKRFFGDVKAICVRDDVGVVLHNQLVSIDNVTSSGYVRYDGELRFDAEHRCNGEYFVRTPLIFIGGILNGKPTEVLRAAVASLAQKDISVKSATVDKVTIAKEERIDLSAMTEVTLVKVKFELEEYLVYDINCEFDICVC